MKDSDLGRRDARASRPQRLLVAAALAVSLVAIAFSNQLGRAEPTGRYRPELPPPALVSGCYPLPDGVRLDFPYVVRTDGDDGSGRRSLVMHVDLVDDMTVRRLLVEAFVAAGFAEGSTPDPETLTFSRSDVGSVRATVRALPGADEKDAIVRATLELDLPSVEPPAGDAACDESSTKRFADEETAS